MININDPISYLSALAKKNTTNEEDLKRAHETLMKQRELLNRPKNAQNAQNSQDEEA